jgi:protein-tyrosine phosphatase
LKKVLVICHGNVNRSPACAAVLAGDPRLKVTSAGLREKNVGMPAAKKMREAMAHYGFDLSGHRAQLVTQEMVDEADVVMYMDSGNLEKLVARFPMSGAKLRCLAEWAPGWKKIPDPAWLAAKSDEFSDVVQLIVSASRRYLEDLK